jgi:nucleoside transporter
VSPVFLGLFADRLFSTEKVLAVLHILGAGLLAWAAFSCADHQPRVRESYEAAARTVQVGDHGTLLTVLQSGKADELKGEDKSRLEKAEEEVQNHPAVQQEVKKTFDPLFWLLIGYALVYMPTLTLTNSISFHNLSDPDRYFGGIRVWGTIGWIVAGLLVGFLNLGVSAWPLYVAAGGSIVLGLFCFALPHTPPSGGAKTLGDTLGLPALAMVKERSFLIFLICSFLISIVLKFYYQQCNPFLEDIDAPYPAAVQTLGQFLEIFFMLLIPIGLVWAGTKGMLLMGMLAWCLRYGIFATQNVPAVVGIGLPIHGICYDFFFVVAYLYVDRHAPKHLRASAQGLYTFVTLGVAMLLGALITGSVKTHFTVGNNTDWTRFWLVPLAGSLATAVAFVLLFRESTPAIGSVTVAQAAEGLVPIEPSEKVQ